MVKKNTVFESNPPLSELLSEKPVRPLFPCEYTSRLKLYAGMHRFFPTLVKMEGGSVVELPVNHRPRRSGTPKYNIRNRILCSFVDLLAVCWMKKRQLNYDIEEQ